MKKIITAALACAMILSSLCACAPAKEELPPLPEKYSLMDEGRTTSTKDQGNTGMCGAYSVVKASESSIITDGLAEADDIDLSEAHLFYYAYLYEDERDSEYLRDGIYLHGERAQADGSHFQFGGLPHCFLNQFANGAGPVDESLIEFDPENFRNCMKEFNQAHQNGEITRYSGEYLLKEMDIYKGYETGEVYQTASLDTVKRAIINEGAVAAGTAMGTDHFRRAGDYTSYFAGVHNEDIFDYANHAITIIGWDDSFPREKFGYRKPENDGAWLVQDSRGTSLGQNGLYWSSYEEALTGYTTTNFSPRDQYGDILFYDSLWMRERIKSESGDTVTANVFPIEKDSALKAVGVPTSAIDQPVVIEIYRNPDAGSPDSGRRVAKIKTTIDNPGYHVVDLEKTVDFAGGDTFSVVVTYRADKSGENQWLGSVPVESDFTEEEAAEYYPTFDYQFTSYPGESFVKHDGQWHDTSDPATAALFGKDVPLNNFGIKALMDKE